MKFFACAGCARAWTRAGLIFRDAVGARICRNCYYAAPDPAAVSREWEQDLRIWSRPIVAR